MRTWLTVLSGLLLVLFTASAHAAVSGVTLFPGSALITETVQVTPGGDGSVVLRLPAVADPGTLRLSASGGASVSDMNWKRETPDESPRVAEARAALLAAEQRRDSVRADHDAAGAEKAFWMRQGGAGDLKAQDAVRLAGTLADRMAKLGRTIAELKRELAEREEDVAAARRELERLTSGGEASWLVEARVSTTKAVKLSYTYRARGCGWHPVYTLDARPRADMVRFSFQAEMWQATGADWQNVPLTLATLEPRTGLTPPPVRPWVLEPVRPKPRTFAKNAPMMEMAVMADEGQAVGGAAPQPREVAMATYAAWQLGKRTLATGKHPRVTLDQEDWKADFLYTLRPAFSPAAYLTAKVKLEAPRELPAGEALYQVDGAVLGRRTFGAAGKELEIFFGSDPLVIGSMELDEKKSGEKGFFGKKQTLMWSWLITAENHKGHAVTVRVEDPEPQSRDGRIKLTMTTKPQAKTDGHVLYWQMRLSPGEKMAVSHTVQATAPEDMRVEPGR